MPEIKLDRRSFIKFAAVAVELSLLSQFNVTTARAEPRHKPQSQEDRLLADITSYRETIGLQGLPQELQAVADGAASRRTDWKNQPTPYKNQLSPYIFSYGERLLEYTEHLLGPTARAHLVTASVDDHINPLLMAALLGNQQYLIPAGITWEQPFSHPNPVGETFNDYIDHETFHQIDPAWKPDFYPWDMLLKIESGKWLMLSQVFSVKGHFLEDLESKKYPEGDYSKGLTYPLGKTAVYSHFGDPATKPDIKPVEAEAIKQVIRETAISQGKLKPQDPDSELSTLVYTKPLTEEIGRELLRRIKDKRFVLTGELLGQYRYALETSLAEQFVEMGRFTISQQMPNLIISEGVRQVLSALHGQEVSLDRLKTATAHPSVRTLFLNRLEEAQYFPDQANLRVRFLEDDPDPRVRKVIADYKGFIDGKLPGDIKASPDQHQLLQQYMVRFVEAIHKHPSLIDTRATRIKKPEVDEPELHYWVMEELEEAADAGFIRKVLSKSTSGILTPEDIGQINHRSEIINMIIH